MKALVLDIETKKLADEVGGFGNAHLMEVAVIGAWRSDTAMYKIFRESDMEEFVKWIEWSDTLVGYNIADFDLKVLSKYINVVEIFNQKRIIDMIKIVKKVTGRFVSLDKVANATLGIGKTEGMTGAMAPILFREGKLHDLYTYQLDDVQVTVKLFYHILRFGEIKDSKGNVYKIKEKLANLLEDDGQMALNL